MSAQVIRFALGLRWMPGWKSRKNPLAVFEIRIIFGSGGSGRVLPGFMEEIVIKIRNHQKAQALLKFLREMDFVEVVRDIVPEREDAANFLEAAGIWAGRVVDVNSLRKQAWRDDTV